jgi:hypothetical protein
MRIRILVGFGTALLAMTTAAGAQGVVGGAEQGVHDGNRAAGPVGGVVGGVAGAVTGGISGLIGLDQRPRFHDYVAHERHNSYTYDRAVAVGAVLPGAGVTYYDVPTEYGVQQYRYAIINGQTVLVDPKTHRIVEVIE